QWHGLGSPANPELWHRDGVAGTARAGAERMAKRLEIGPYESRRRSLDDRRDSFDLDRFGPRTSLGSLPGSKIPAVSLVPCSKPWLARLGIRWLDSAIYYQYPRRGAVLARLYPASSGGGLGPGSVVGERNSVVLIPLEFWLADLGDVAAN